MSHDWDKEETDYIEKTGKTVEDAKRLALIALGDVCLEDIIFEVLDEGSKGFLTFGSRPAKVRASVKYDPVKVAKKFLHEVSVAMGMDIVVDVILEDKHMNINMIGTNMGIFIGKRGQTLDSLQYLVNLTVNKGNMPYISVTLDTENYRQRRKETLEVLAQKMAAKVKQTKKSVILEPMSSYERRIIHATLQSDRFVTTYSEGEDPYRNVVITIKKDSKFTESRYNKANSKSNSKSNNRTNSGYNENTVKSKVQNL